MKTKYFTTRRQTNCWRIKNSKVTVVINNERLDSYQNIKELNSYSFVKLSYKAARKLNPAFVK